MEFIHQLPVLPRALLLPNLTLQEQAAEGQAAVPRKVKQLWVVAQGQHCRDAGDAEPGMHFKGLAAARSGERCSENNLQNKATQPILPVNWQKQDAEASGCQSSASPSCVPTANFIFWAHPLASRHCSLRARCVR